MPDLCSELERALQRNLDAQQSYMAARAALGLSVGDRLERDLGLDLFGFLLGETQRHEESLRKVHRMYCLPGGD